MSADENEFFSTERGYFVRKFNAPLFELPATHPARQFLEEFIECREECAGREYDMPGTIPIEQTWISESEKKQWTFSGFMYSCICFDITLDGWLMNSPEITKTEQYHLNNLPRFRTLMNECEAAARADGNADVLPLVGQVQKLLVLWEACILSRLSERAKKGVR